MSAAFLGLDLGTSSLKALVLADDGRTALGVASAAYPLVSPHADWSETDPADWWSAAIAATHTALDRAGRPPIAAIGLDAQMHGHVLVDAALQPLRRAILWSDGRASASEARYAGLTADQRRRLGNPFITGAAGATLLWIAEHEPDVLAAARWSLLPKDWLRTRLVDGPPVTDPSDASANLLWDVPGDGWAIDIMADLGLDPDLMPPVRASATIAGPLTAVAAEALGLERGIPVAVGSADAPAALVGTGLVAPGRVQLTVGTGAQALTLVELPTLDPTRRTHLFRSALAGQWYAMAAVQNSGLALDWVRRALDVEWSELFAAIGTGIPRDDDPLFIPNLSRERPQQPAPGPGAAFVGIHLNHGREALLRASLEGVALGIRLAVEALPGAAPDATLVLAGGGGVDPGYRQLLADVLGHDLQQIDVEAASARGSALIAGVAVGHWPSVAAAAATTVAPGLVTHVRPEVHDAYAVRHRRFLEMAQRVGRPGPLRTRLAAPAPVPSSSPDG